MSVLGPNHRGAVQAHARRSLVMRPQVRSVAGPRLLLAGTKPAHSFLGDQLDT